MKKAKNRSISKLAAAAFEQAAIQVIQVAKQTGTAVIVWKNGRVQALPSEEMELANTRTPRKKKKWKKSAGR